MSEQNKIDEIKAVHAASSPEWYDYLKHDAYEYITYLLQLVDELNGALDEPKKNLWFQLHNERMKKHEVTRERNELLRKVERKDEALRTMAESPDEWYVGRTPMREYARQALEAL